MKVSYEFDQSGYVRGALDSVLREGLLGALLTGLMVLLFLGDWRSSAIVVVTIPFALLTAVVALWAAGETVNIMTLGGLALAVGVLVDEGTVVMENIHSHLARGEGSARAVLDASREVVTPRLLAMLAVLAVFVPSLFMVGVTRALFVPLTLAVGFAMAASYFLSSALVPVLSTALLGARGGNQAAGAEAGRFLKVRDQWMRGLGILSRARAAVIAAYAVAALAVIFLLGPRLATELFPTAQASQFRLRLDAPAGTRAEETANQASETLDEVGKEAGPGNVETTVGYVGTQAASYPINTVFLWTSGPQEAVFSVQLRPEAHLDLEAFKERLRRRLGGKFPGSTFSFEPGDIVSQIMNFGAPTPVEVAVNGPDFAAVRDFAEKIRARMGQVSALRDLRVEQPLRYPGVQVKVNRQLAGQLGVTVGDVARSLSEATASSRFTLPNYWADPRTGVAYQVQVQYPQPRITSVEDIANIPVMPGAAQHPLLGDVADVADTSLVGELDRKNGLWQVTLAADIASEDLGKIAKGIDAAVRGAGAPPRAVSVQVGGQIAPMRETFSSLGIGLLVAVAVIFLLLAANFESLRLAWVVLTLAPAAISGVVIMLLVSGTTLNIESFMGAIMAIGVGTANAILLVTFAEQYRRAGAPAIEAALEGTRTRMRPILMTSLAMIAGMVPMALAWGTGAEETAPLARAVIGGLVAATLVNLSALPLIYSWVQGRAGASSLSLDPEDPESRFAEK